MSTNRERRFARAIEGLSAHDMRRFLDGVFSDCSAGFRKQRMDRMLDWSEQVISKPQRVDEDGNATGP